MAKNLVNGTNVVIEENGDNINLNLSSAYTNNLEQNITDSFKNNNIYSETETVIGKWIDNKPIYRKVLTGTLPTGSGENVFTVPNAKIINFNGIIKSTYNQWWPIPAIYSEDNYRIYTYISLDRTQLKVDCGSYFSTNSQYEIIIEYTKTTD